MSRSVTRIAVLAALLIGWGLAMARLGDRSLWADEGFTAVLARDAASVGLLKILRLDPNQGALHMVVMSGVSRLGGGEFVLRFPSAMAAILVLPLVYQVGRRLMSTAAGAAGAFLHAISPYIVGYAQEARPYALLELLACLSLVLTVAALARNRWYSWAGLSVNLSLLLYTHHFGWFVLAAEFLFCSVVVLLACRARRRIDPRAAPLAVCFLLGVALYLPWLPMLLRFWRQSGPGGSPLQTAGLPTFDLSLRFLRDMLAVFGSRSSGWPLYLLSVSLCFGAAALVCRRRWQALLLAGLWFAIPLAVLDAAVSAHFFDFRYVIFFIPVLLLVAGEGLAAVGRLAVRLASRLGASRVAPLVAVGLAVLLFVPANYPGLRTHYGWEKENWRGISAFVRDNLLPDDAIYVSPRYWSNPMRYYQPELRDRLVGGSAQDLEELVGAAGRQPGLWFLRFSGKLGDPTGQLGAWLEQQGFVLLIDGRTCGSGVHAYYGRTGPGSEARLSELLHKAAEFCPADARIGKTP